MAECKKMGTEQPQDTMAICNGEYTKQEIMFLEVSKLKKEGILKAMKKWGQPKSKITHLVFCTPTFPVMPDPDHHLTKLFGFGHSVQHVSYEQGCFEQNTVLRIFRDFANNNRDTRVLVVCSVITVSRGGEASTTCVSHKGIGKVEIKNLHIHIRGDVHIHVRPEEAEAWFGREGIKLDENAGKPRCHSP